MCTHTHTHTHTYMYIYVWVWMIAPCVFHFKRMSRIKLLIVHCDSDYSNPFSHPLSLSLSLSLSFSLSFSHLLSNNVCPCHCSSSGFLLWLSPWLLASLQKTLINCNVHACLVCSSIETHYWCFLDLCLS